MSDFIENFETDKKDLLTKIKEAIGEAMLEVKMKKLSDDAVIPTYAHEGDMGMDLTAISVEYDSEKDMYMYHTGLAMETYEHFGTLLFPRSSNMRTDAYLCNHVGVVDSSIYRGEILLCFKNRDSLMTNFLNAKIERFFSLIRDGYDLPYAEELSEREARQILDNPIDFAPYKVGERIAQMVVIPYPMVKIIEWNGELSESVRGNNGFCSSGK